jgi:hypothetical protein
MMDRAGFGDRLDRPAQDLAWRVARLPPAARSRGALSGDGVPLAGELAGEPLAADGGGTFLGPLSVDADRVDDSVRADSAGQLP